MRHFFVLTFLLGIKTLCSQDVNTYNFSIEENRLVWQNIYDVQGKRDELKLKIQSHLNQLSWIKDTKVSDDGLYGRLEAFKVDYKRYGGTAMGTAFVISSGLWNGAVQIDIKDNKYRVRITSITNKTTVNTLTNNLTSDFVAEEIFLRKNRVEFKPGQSVSMDLLDQALSDVFKLSVQSLKSDF